MPIHSLGRLGLFGLLLAFATGCPSTDQTRDVEPSGFLADYSQLKPGRADQAKLIYINPEADFSPYERVIIDPVVLWDVEGSRLSDIPLAELQALADYFQGVMREQLALEFQVVEQREPGTLRIRLAIVDADRSNPPSEAAFLGRVGIEVEILDAGSGERLVAAADARGDEDKRADSSSEGTNVREAFDEWAGRARDRLAVFRAFDAAQRPRS